MALIRMHRDPALGEPHVADVHPDEAPKWEARGWVVGEAPPPEGKTITGLANTVWDPSDYREDRAATEGQLAAVAIGGGSAVDLSGFAKKAELAQVATSGSYRDLSDPPDIPEAYDDTDLVSRVEALEAAPGGQSARVFVATYNVTTAREIRDYLDSAQEPFAPIVVKRGNDYYTAALATKSGDDGAILRVMGSGSGDYIIFNYTIRGSSWASASYTFQKKLTSGADIKTLNNQSLLGSGNIDIGLPQYQLCDNDSGGNVIQTGEIVIGGTTYGLFEFYYQTGLLPAANATVAYSLANLLASYAVKDFIDATGITSDGIFIGNGRTDGENRLIVQQFSKNSKTVTIRAYKDFSEKTATLKIRFIGTKN